MQLLTKKQQSFLKEERNTLWMLKEFFIEFGGTEDDKTALSESLQQLDDFFLLVVVGEFNSGKSAVINALLGTSLLKEGVTPTTTQINILQYGEEQSRTIDEDNLVKIRVPVEQLQDLSIVDTPGTNAVIRQHEQITAHFVPRADLVLFITSVDRPFTESERSFLKLIDDWGKKVVFVINKIDNLQSDEELEQIIEFVKDNAQKQLQVTPEIFPISARLASKAKQDNPDLWQSSRFEALEKYLEDTLDEKGRLRYKFLNPIGVGKHLVNRYLGVLDERNQLLQADLTAIQDINSQLEIYRKDMIQDFEYRLADIENYLYEMEQRAQEYFDENIRLTRVFELLNKEKIQREFTQQVIGDVPKQLELKVNTIIDWMVEADLAQWQAVTEHITRRIQLHESRIVGAHKIGSFHYDRKRLIEGIGEQARQVIQGYDKEKEAHQLASGVQNAIAAAAVLEVGAIGVGALVTALATTVAVDVTGIILAGLIAALGLFVLPARRRLAKDEIHKKVDEMRLQLTGSLRSYFTQEIDRSIQNIRQTIAPYTRFIQSENEAIGKNQNLLTDIKVKLQGLEDKLENIL